MHEMKVRGVDSWRRGIVLFVTLQVSDLGKATHEQFFVG
jgi:hypothetical protein